MILKFKSVALLHGSKFPNIPTLDDDTDNAHNH